MYFHLCSQLLFFFFFLNLGYIPPRIEACTAGCSCKCCISNQLKSKFLREDFSQDILVHSPHTHPIHSYKCIWIPNLDLSMVRNGVIIQFLCIFWTSCTRAETTFCRFFSSCSERFSKHICFKVFPLLEAFLASWLSLLLRFYVQVYTIPESTL